MIPRRTLFKTKQLSVFVTIMQLTYRRTSYHAYSSPSLSSPIADENRLSPDHSTAREWKNARENQHADYTTSFSRVSPISCGVSS